MPLLFFCLRTHVFFNNVLHVMNSQLERYIMGYIVVDGIDGSGKSSICRELSKLAVASHFTVESVCEPGGTEVGKELREIFKKNRSEVIHPMAEAMIIGAARVQVMTRKILPAIEAGELVISDRSYQSTLAMQAWAYFRRDGDVALRDSVVETVRTIQKLFPWSVPEFTAIIDVPVEVAMDRIRARGELDRLENQGEDMMRWRREGFIAHDALLANPTGAKPVIYDGTRPVEETARKIWDDYCCYQLTHSNLPDMEFVESDAKSVKEVLTPWTDPHAARQRLKV